MVIAIIAALYGAILALVVQALRKEYRKESRARVVFELETVTEEDVYQCMRAFVVDEPDIRWRSA